MNIPLKDELLSKKDRLENIKETLKQEFVGIDDIIDEIVDAVSSWYLVPSMQSRPLIVNLWGMTGVGKTAVVKRIAELINFEKHFYKFDMGEIGPTGLKMRWQFEDIANVLNKKPFMICFDEFQFGRTIDEHGNKLNKTASRIVWEILDDGEVNLNSSSNHTVQDITDLCQILQRILKEDIQVREGQVVSGVNLYREFMKRAQFKIGEEKGSDHSFVPKRCYSNIRDIGRDFFSSNIDVEHTLYQLDGRETIELLQRIIEKSNGQQKLDCSKAIIFIIGNLDEAFSMSGDINPDLSADQFHRNSLKINVSNIKQTLQSYFRPEQVARLGNNHLVYPAFNKQGFQKIIDLEFDKINDQLVKEAGVPIVFHQSVKQLIYEEGVYPTLGTRPLFSTISNYISSKLGLIVSDLIVQDEPVHSLLVKHKNEQMIFEYLAKGKNIICRRKFSSKGRLSKLRESKRDDEQANAAVHESGHTILAIFLMGITPKVVCSNSADATNNGFTFIHIDADLITKKDIVARAAMGLGGYLAEKLVFGEEYVHAGSRDDLEKTTRLVCGLIKKEGMGSDLVNVNTADPGTNFTYHDNKGLFNEAVLDVIRQAEKLAEDTLKREMDKLLTLADYLSDQRKIEKEDIIGLLGIGNHRNQIYPYRKKLQGQLKKMATEKKSVA